MDYLAEEEEQRSGYALSLAIELPVLAGVLKIIDRVGGSGVLRIVSYLLAFMCVSSSSLSPAVVSKVALCLDRQLRWRTASDSSSS